MGSPQPQQMLRLPTPTDVEISRPLLTVRHHKHHGALKQALCKDAGASAVVAYSLASAPSTSSRAARRAGSCAASNPASAEAINSTNSVPTGIEIT